MGAGHAILFEPSAAGGRRLDWTSLPPVRSSERSPISTIPQRIAKLAWDVRRAAAVIGDLAPTVRDPQRRRILEDVAERIDRLPLDGLPTQVIHNDLNDDNVLLENDRVVGVIDVGDAIRSVRIAEAAIAATYAMLDQEDPVSVGAAVGPQGSQRSCPSPGRSVGPPRSGHGPAGNVGGHVCRSRRCQSAPHRVGNGRMGSPRASGRDRSRGRRRGVDRRGRSRMPTDSHTRRNW